MARRQVSGETSWDMPADAAHKVRMKRCGGCGGFGRGLVKAHNYCLHCSRTLDKPPPGGYEKYLP
eukprot:948946-Prorocentrum_minimum.AAC.2